MKISDEIITSKQNRIVVETAKLLDKKSREKARLFRFDGLKLFLEAVEKGVEITRIFILESKSEALLEAVKRNGDKLGDAIVTILSDDAFSKISEEQAPEGIVSVAKYPTRYCSDMAEGALAEYAADKSRRILMLESVRDPGNVGTILRSAAAFGINAIVLSSDCADLFNPKTVRGAMGALFKMKLFVFVELERAVEILKNSGRTTFAAALDKSAVRLDEAEVRACDVAVIGNEGHGLSEKIINACDKTLYIPMEEGSESLNAAIAASVIMWSMYGKR